MNNNLFESVYPQLTTVSPTQIQTVINNLVQKIYQFEIKVSDDQGTVDRNIVPVTVILVALTNFPLQFLFLIRIRYTISRRL